MRLQCQPFLPKHLRNRTCISMMGGGFGNPAVLLPWNLATLNRTRKHSKTLLRKKAADISAARNTHVARGAPTSVQSIHSLFRSNWELLLEHRCGLNPVISVRAADLTFARVDPLDRPLPCKLNCLVLVVEPGELRSMCISGSTSSPDDARTNRACAKN